MRLRRTDGGGAGRTGLKICSGASPARAPLVGWLVPRWRGRGLFAAQSANEGYLLAQTDERRGNDDRPGDPVAGDEHDDPEDQRSGKTDAEERRSTDLAIELFLVGHG